MSNHLLLPKKDEEGMYYLSYSQKTKWKKSKRDYIRKYFFGEDEDNSGLQKYGDFGHRVGGAFENDDYSSFEPDEIAFLKTIPKYDQFEREIRLNMDGFYLKGFIDTNTDDLDKLADYKTGEIAKRQAEYESDEYEQLDIYSAAIEQETGKLPTDVKVFLIGRSGNAFQREELTLTKEFVTITKEVTMERIEAVKKSVQSVAEEISDYYRVYLKLNELT